MADVRITQYPLKSIVSDNDIFLIADSNDVDVNGFLKYKKVRAKDLPSIVNTAESITYANLMASIAADDLIIGTFYRITDSTSGVSPLLVQAVGVDAIGYLAFDGTNPLVTINYDVMTDTIRWSLNQTVAPISLGSLSATTPLSYNNTTGVFTISQSNATTNGYLSSADWNTFTAKQNAGNYITALTGEATASGPVGGGSAAITLDNTAVIGKVLSGLNVTGGNVVSTDSILTAFGKTQNQINALVGGVMFQGVWDAATNNPALTSSVGTKGYYYVVNVAGSTNLNGITDWKVGDWAIFDGTAWQKVDNTDSVSSVFGRVGAVVAASGDYTTTQVTEGTNLYYTEARVDANSNVAANTAARHNAVTLGTANGLSLSTQQLSLGLSSASANGALSSTDWSTFSGKQNALGGTGIVKSTGGTISYLTDNSTNWNTAYNDSIVSAGVTGTSTKTLTLNQQDGGTVTASWSDADTGLTSVGLTMPSAFSVANSPLTANGTLAVTGAGVASQYVRGDGTLAAFPTTSGGGSSVSYYFNGGTNQGTIGGNTYYEMSKNAIIGTNADFNINADGYVAQFVTDANDPSLLSIPAGNWNFEMWFSASSGGGSPSFYLELYKYDGATLTLIASGSANPEVITGGTAIDLYTTALAVPLTTLTLTDRLAVRVYVTHSSKTITLHTQNGHLCQAITTFSTGLNALNGLTSQVQYLAVGTSGTDFGISSATSTHTFNLPTASATNRGALSSADWTTFNNKQNALTNPITGTGTTNYLPKFTGASALGNSLVFDNGSNVGINTTGATYRFEANAGSSQYINARFYGSSHSMIQVESTTAGFQALIAHKSPTGEYSVGLQGDGRYAIYHNTGAAERFTISAAGNVGIGTTSPNHLLTLNNTASGGTYFGLYQSYVDGNDWRNWAIGTNDQAFGDFVIKQSNATGGNPNSAGTIRLYIAKSGEATFSSSVTADGLVKSNQAASGTPIFWANSTNASSFASTLFYGSTAVAASSGFDFIGMEANGVAQFNVSGNGNVTAKGSVTAGDLLQTSYGTARIQVTSTTNSANSAFRLSAKNASGTTKNAGLYYVSGATSADTFMSFAADDTNYQFNFLANGNCLIGTTTDAGYKLDVNGTARVSGAFTVSTGRTGLFSGDNFSLALGETVGQSNYFYLGTNSSGDLLMSNTGGVAKLTITQAGAATFSSSVTANGNVNIKTSTAYSDLNIGDGSASSGISIRATSGSTPVTIPTKGLQLHTGYGVSYISSYNNSDALSALYFGANNYYFDGGPIAISNSVTSAVAVASTHKVEIVIGGVTYYLLASNV